MLWAYNQGDYQNLAGTFLIIDKGVDTGGPLSFIYPEVNPSDSLEVIEAKLALLARDNICKAMSAAVKSATLAIEEDKQENFMIRFVDYGPKDHLTYYSRRLRNKLLPKSPILTEEKTTFA